MGPHGDAGSMAGEFDRWALEALQWNWGKAYDITVMDGGLWRARRRDGLGGPIEAASPGRLVQELLDDYRMRPVSRD